MREAGGRKVEDRESNLMREAGGKKSGGEREREEEGGRKWRVGGCQGRIFVCLALAEHQQYSSPSRELKQIS